MSPTRVNVLPAPLDFTIARHTFRLLPEALSRADPHTVDPVPFFAPQTSNSPADVSFADTNRSVELPQAQNDFTGGLARKLDFSSATAKQFRYAKNIDTSGPPGLVFPGPKVTTIGAVIAGQPMKAVQKGNITYVACGTLLYQITDLTTRTLDTTFADAITDLIVWNDRLVVGFGEAAATNMSFRISDTIAAAFTSCGVKGTYFAIANNNPVGPVFYRTLDTTPSIAASTDVTATSTWVSFNVGNTDSPINGLTAYGDHIIVGKQDGPYSFTTDYIAYRVVDASFAIEQYANVCRANLTWNGIYFFSGKHSLYTFDGQRVKAVGFDTLADPQVPGGYYAVDRLTADPHFVYATLAEKYSGAIVGGVYIWKTPDGGQTWHNYLWRSDLGQGSTLLWATNKLGSVSQNAVLFAYKSGVNWQLAWAGWAATLDPTKDSSYVFDSTTVGKLRTLDHTAGLATVPKRTSRLKVIADHLTASAVVDAYIYNDNDAVAKVQSFTLSPNQELKLLRGQDFFRASLEFWITGISGLAATVQQFRGYEFPVRLLTRVVRRHVVRVMAADSTPLATGGRAGRRGSFVNTGSYADVLDDLRTLRRDNAEVDVTDEDGREFTAYLVDITERSVYHPDGGHRIKAATVELIEVTEA